MVDGDNKDKNPTDNPKDEPEVVDKTDKSKIRLEISRDPEIDALQKELAKLGQEHDALKKKTEDDEQKWIDEKGELEDKITVMTAEKEKRAMELFEQEKTDIVKLCEDSGLAEDKVNEIKEKLDSPQKLETVKALVEMMIAVMPKPADDGGQSTAKPNPDDDDTAGKKPQGKAVITPPTALSQEEEDAVKIIDDVYHVLNNPQQYTPQQIKEAETKRKTLVNSMIKGKSWSELRKGMTIGNRVTMACPSCGRTIVGERIPNNCQNCGFDFTKTDDIPSRRR